METIAPTQSAYINATKLVPHGTAPQAEGEGFANFLFGKDGFGMGDIIDTINPLHHIPVVSTFYQNITGDQIANAPQLIGGAITGGPMGLASAALNVTSRETTDKGIGNHIIDFFAGEDDPTQPSSAFFAKATKLAPDNGSAALELFQGGTLDASAALAAKSLLKTPQKPVNAASTAQNDLTNITQLYSQKQSQLGVSTQLADIKA